MSLKGTTMLNRIRNRLIDWRPIIIHIGVYGYFRWKLWLFKKWLLKKLRITKEQRISCLIGCISQDGEERLVTRIERN